MSETEVCDDVGCLSTRRSVAALLRTVDMRTGLTEQLIELCHGLVIATEIPWAFSLTLISLRAYTGHFQ